MKFLKYIPIFFMLFACNAPVAATTSFPIPEYGGLILDAPPTIKTCTGMLVGHNTSPATCSPFTLSGNTTEFGTISGSVLNGDCAIFDSHGNIIDGGGSCGGGGGGLGANIKVDTLTIVSTNVVPNLSQNAGNFVQLVINGGTYTNVGTNPAFTVVGTAVTWSAANAGFSLNSGDNVKAVYSTSLDTAIQADSLTVTGTNTLTNISQTYLTGNFIELIVNSNVYSNAGSSPSFSVSGQVITWNPSNVGFNLSPGDNVVALYSTAVPLGVGVNTALALAPDTAGGVLLTPANPGAYYFGVAGVPALVPVYDVVAYGASPSNSATANATAFQAAFTAAAAGGRIHIPCGSYSINATPAVTVAANARVSLVGDGNGCVFINMQGAAVNGPTLTMTNADSSFAASGFTVTTNQAGGVSALVAKLTNGSGTTFSSSSFIDEIGIHGDDYYSPSVPSTHYFDIGIDLTGINNLNIRGGDCNGNNAAGSGNTPQTDCISYQGSGVGGNVPGGYAVVLNVQGMTAANCKSLINAKDWWQGIQVVQANASNCTHGVYGSVVSPVGLLTELQVTGGQFATFSSSVEIDDPLFAGLYVTGVQIAALPGTGIKAQGTQFNITGNNIACNLNSNTIGIDVVSSFAQGGTISNNNISACAEGIKNEASATTVVIENSNHMSGNGYGTAALSISGTTATVSGYSGLCPLSLFANFGGGSTTLAPGAFVVGNWYQIATLGGSPAFTSIGAASNTVGVTFQATGVGSGSGTATWIVEPGTDITAFGSGTGGNGTYTINNTQTFSGNIVVFWTAASQCDYVTSSSANITIEDKEKRAYTQIPAYQNAIGFSKFFVVDTSATTFGGAISAGGGAHSGIAFADFGAGGYTLH